MTAISGRMCKRYDMNYNEALDYLNNTSWYAEEPGLDRISELLDRLGRPQEKLRFIHIAGTNGKGSCAAMIASIMKCCGYKTGLFTSPYLFRFNERMQINGKQIDNDILSGIATVVRASAEGMEKKPTAFELMTACALKWFAEQGCDIAVLEAGMGGIYDATNVIECPEASVIMNIGLDHTKVLGETVEEIAGNKAGIIKKGCSCVVYEQIPSVEEVFRSRCEEMSAPLRIAAFSEINSEFDSIEGQVFTYKGVPYALPLLGKNQLKNAAVVLETVEVLREKGWRLEQSEVEHGLYSVSWPGRFEIVSDEPCFVVDGGHNPQCAQTVVENLDNYFAGVPRVFLTGLLSDKDFKSVLRILAPAGDEFICITPPSPRALPASELATELESLGKTASAAESIEDGIAVAIESARRLGGIVCATGSLYSVGKIREYFNLT